MNKLISTNDVRVIDQRVLELYARVDAYEGVLGRFGKSIDQLVSGINNALGDLNQRLVSQSEVLDALVEAIGKDKVEELIKAGRVRRMHEVMESEKKALEDLRASGELVEVPLVTEKSVIVGREYEPDGQVRAPGRVQVAYARVDAQFQSSLINQPPGTSFVLPNGGKFEVLEIYEVVEKQPASTAATADTSGV